MKLLFGLYCGHVRNLVSDKRPVWCVVVTRCHKLNRLQNKKCFVLFTAHPSPSDTLSSTRGHAAVRI